MSFVRVIVTLSVVTMTLLTTATPTTVSYELLMSMNATCGTELACPELQALVREAQKELCMESYSIEVRKLSERGCKENSTGCAIKRSHLFFDEEALLAMPRDEQRFIIGHELIHVRNAHNRKRRMLDAVISYGGTVLSIIGGWLLWEEITSSYSPYAYSSPYASYSHSTKEDAFAASLVIAGTGTFFSFIFGSCAEKALSRSNEEEADCYAAHELHCALGGCLFFLKEMMSQKDFSYESGLFDTHPPLFKRFLNLVMISGDATLYKLVTEPGEKTTEDYFEEIFEYLEAHIS